MARDGEQQAMSSERLAELEQMAFAFGDWQPARALINGIHELLAEVERLLAALDMRRGCVWSAPERREPRRSLCG